MNKYIERLYNGIIKENPTFVLMLGMCPTLATTTTAINGLGMGLTTTTVITAGIYPKPERVSGYLHSSDRCKLYHSGTCRGICGKERPDRVCI